MAGVKTTTPTTDDQFEQYVSNAASQIGQMENMAKQYDEEANAAPTQYPRTNYVKLFTEQYQKGKPSDEEIKRENNKRKIAALGDGLVALSNMAGAIAGATPLQQNKTLTEAQKQRYEEALKYRPGYMSTQEYNSGMSAAIRQQNAEDSYYNRLRTQEDNQKKNAANNAFKYRQAAEKAWKDLYAAAKKAGIDDAKAKAIIEKYQAATAQGWAKVKDQQTRTAKQPDKSRGETTEEYEDSKGHKITKKTPGVKKKRDLRRKSR